jgi:hypothetical protein
LPFAVRPAAKQDWRGNWRIHGHTAVTRHVPSGQRWEIPLQLENWFMDRWPSDCIQLGMNTMKREYAELLSEYRVALGVWSEARAVYSPDQPEVAAATSLLEALEQELAAHNQPAALAA